MAVSERNLKRFERAVKQLDKVLADCKKELPHCNIYVDGSGSMNLMDGSKQIGEIGDQETILASAHVRDCGGGDW